MKVLIVDLINTHLTHYRRLDEFVLWAWNKNIDNYVFMHDERALDVGSYDCRKLHDSILEQIK